MAKTATGADADQMFQFIGGGNNRGGGETGERVGGMARLVSKSV